MSFVHKKGDFAGAMNNKDEEMNVELMLGLHGGPQYRPVKVEYSVCMGHYFRLLDTTNCAAEDLEEMVSRLTAELLMAQY